MCTTNLTYDDIFDVLLPIIQHPERYDDDESSDMTETLRETDEHNLKTIESSIYPKTIIR